MFIRQVLVPNVGDTNNVQVIEINVKKNDVVKKNQCLITLEVDKAVIEIPSPATGIIKDIHVEIGKHIIEKELMIEIEETNKNSPNEIQNIENIKARITNNEKEHNISSIYASPLVRRISRIFNLDLSKVQLDEKSSRITKKNCYEYIKNVVSEFQNGSKVKKLNYKTENEQHLQHTEIKKMSRIDQLSAKHLSYSWRTIPHVTFHDSVDITHLEKFRLLKNIAAKKLGGKITLLSFIIKTSVYLLEKYPMFNSSLLENNEIILKKYYNIGFAVDSPHGLIIPVIKEANKKSISEIAEEITYLANKTRNNKITPDEIKTLLLQFQI